jgi:hypothetical protein
VIRPSGARNIREWRRSAALQSYDGGRVNAREMDSPLGQQSCQQLLLGLVGDYPKLE